MITFNRIYVDTNPNSIFIHFYHRLSYKNKSSYNFLSHENMISIYCGILNNK